MDRKKNSVTIVGRKLSTLPTPLKIPSITSDCSTLFTLPASIAMEAASVSAPMNISKRPDSHAPTTLNVSQNTAAIIITKVGRAVYFPVKIRSIAALRTCSLLSCGLTTVSLQILLIKEKRMSAMAAARSSPRSFSIWQIICSNVSCSFRSRQSRSSTRVSPSASLAAAKRTGIFAADAWSSIRCIIP